MAFDDFVLVERQDGEQDEGNLPHVTPGDLERIQSWLSPTEFNTEGSEYRKHLNVHVPRTGDWLFQTDQYNDWHGSGTSSIWIQGIPGSGKSVIAANLIQTLKNEDAIVLFFFSRRIIKSNSEPQYLVRDCLYQFLEHSVDLQSKLKRVIEQHPIVGTVPFRELWRILLSALTTVPKVYIVFDALDELAVEKDDFLQRLLELEQKKPESIKLAMTSRPLPHLRTSLKDSFSVNIRLAGNRVETDITTYITHRLATQQERSLTSGDQFAITQGLCQKGHGLFLYARLMLDELLQQSTPVRQQLQNLPSSLEDMYVDLLHEHSTSSGASMHFQSCLLSWITHASRPLRVTELAALVNSRDDRGGLSHSQDAKSMVRTACGPLLEILDDETVQVIHHSFTEFLVDGSRSSARDITEPRKGFPAFTPTLVHRSLTFSCVDYLQSGCFESWSIEERPTPARSHDLEKQRDLMIRFHLLQYASQNLLYHATKCDNIDMDLTSKFGSFFQYGNHAFESWKDFLFAKDNRLTPDNFHPLHVASRAGLTAYTTHLLTNGVSPDLLDSQQRTATAYAAMHGHAETLNALLHQNASFTIGDEDGMAPVHHAARGNHVKALECLLDEGADPMSPKSGEDNEHQYGGQNCSTLGKTPIQFACELGNIDAVTELLQRLKPGSRSGILPHWASETGQAKVLFILLQHLEILANVNKKDVRGNTALFLAACFKDLATVRILLDQGADVHSRSDDFISVPADSEAANRELGWTPLQGWANLRRRVPQNEIHGSIEEWEKTGAILIEAGSDMEARDDKGQTVLFAWTEQLTYHRGFSDRTERFVSLLLRYGANPRASDNLGNTPLHKTMRGHRPISQLQSTRVIGMFVKAGGDINATRQSDLATPLIAAARMQCVDAKPYIDNGADPNTQDPDGNTALHYICKSWLFELSHVREWLTFADPTIKNNKGDTCLYHLRFGNGGEGRVEAIPLLAEKGLDLESKNRLGRTALLNACHIAELDFIYGLIRYGADAMSRDFQNKSCLHMVAGVQMSNHDNGPRDIETASNVIKSLIQAGLDINDIDFNGNTPFHDAIESNGHFTSVKIRLNAILQHKGLANTPNHHGRNALHKVAALKNSDSRHYEHRGVAQRIDFLLQKSLGLDLHAQDNQGIMPIHVAAATSEVNLWEFVKAGADIQAQANDGRNPLHFAAGAAQSNIVGLLCNIFSDKSWAVDQTDEIGRTALHYAASSGSSECVYYLLRLGANPNAKDRKGLTPLHAVAEHQIDAAKLRKHRKYKEHPHWTDGTREKDRLTPYMDTRQGSPFYKVQWRLSLAISEEDEACMAQDVVGLLLSVGADPSIRDESGQTPYEAAVFLKNDETVNALFSVHASADTKNSFIDQWYSVRKTKAQEIVQSINVKDTDAYSLLQTAIDLRDESAVDALLKAGVDPTVLGPDALTPVHTIAHWGLVSMMKILVSHIKDLNKFSPPLLHVAASRELSNIQMMDLLICLGVNVSASYQEVEGKSRRTNGASPSSYAAAHILAMGEQWWNISALESLCKAGADLEMTDAEGNTVLQCAVNGSTSGFWGPGFWRDETLEVLLKHGANINTLSPENGQTPLIAALESRRGRKLIQKLLDCGADITLGEVPAIFEAIESEDVEATAAILDAGADVNALYHPKKPRWYGKGPKAETPLLAAAMKYDGIYMHALFDEASSKNSRLAIGALLLERGANSLMELQDGRTTVIHEIARCHGYISPSLRADVDLERKDFEGRTPLLVACCPVGRYYRVVENESTPCKLILAGGNVNAADNTGCTPLHLAIQSSLTKTVDLLLEKGALASATNNAGLTPLYYALINVDFRSQLKLTKALLSAGANPRITGPNGETPLHLLAPSLIRIAPFDSREAIVTYRDDGETDYLMEFKALYQSYVDKGCDRNGRDHQGNTSLFPYVKEVKQRYEELNVDPPAEEDIRKIFGEHDLLAVNDEGDTLLHAVAGRKEGEESIPDGIFLFKELMARGLDPKRENLKGVSALDVAAACGKEEILGLFARED